MAIYSLFLTISVFVASVPCFSNQRSLLLQLKNNLTFNSTMSTKLVKWNQSADCCSWEGVTCNEGRVIGLDLADEYISGGIDNSSSLFSLQHLESLSLAYNNFSHEIPSQFCKLENLSYLNLSNAYFTGQIPIAISRLTRLVILDLSSEELVLENPNLKVLVQNLSALMELYLGGVFISAQGSEWCRALSSSLPNLRVLSLSYCNLFGPIDSSLQNLQSLSIIRLNDNKFNGSIPNFSMCKNLTTVRLESCNFVGSIPNFSMCKNLTTVRLSNNYLSGEIISTQWEELLNLETLDLGGNLLNGNIPDSLFSLPSLKMLDLSRNQFSGQLKEFSNASSTLEYLYLDNNLLEGPIPMSISELHGLKTLSLGSNKFNKSLNLSVIQQLKNLSYLDLSHTSLLSEYNDFNFSLSSVPLDILILASCKLKKIPDFLRNQSYLFDLDLSHNQIFGEMPNWIWKLPNLVRLDLSYNFLVTLEGPILNVSLLSLYLRSNQLQGQLPNIPHAEYLDFSGNQLQGQLPNIPHVEYLDLSGNSLDPSILANISWSLPSILYLFLSSNKLYGSIPISICNATNLELLDLSNNSISGTIPQCLIKMTDKLGVLDLRTNNLSGIIPDAFPDNCGLETLSLNKNQLEGRLPKSLANCSWLEVLDIGNNHIEGTFPFFLKNTTRLSVLVLRSNKFYGSITHPELNLTWPGLQIVDIASNNFTGTLPIILLLSWTSMMDRGNEVGPELNYYLVFSSYFLYQDTITITSKGFSVELEKILTSVTVLDFSCNNFDGHIPREIGELTLLYSFNLSHNAFTGQIPASLGKLSHLESLDLSSNNLSGEIPVQLANGLIFLSVLNLSFNQLVGQIPLIKQFSTFSATSFERNKRLCGFPLKSKCIDEDPRLPPPTYEESHGRGGGYGIINMLMTLCLRSSINCVLEKNIIKDEHSEIKSRCTSYGYEAHHLQVGVNVLADSMKSVRM
ncbi:hypothetical protein FH972_011535 [Carpinus fangiana]|uniref:Leucine-rich repeat-containing N-terminal plant-type domain-containing protein n=1 Tax=Carpinus fangiana TaxID=176857 RepID=A0A660KRR5_9ROSI|nr:hypothetical protein FH972_011535 [Carpinus fangiana]